MPERQSNQETPELLMPVSDDHALRRFEIEALQRINDNLRLLNSGQAEMVKGMHAIDIRLTRIESNSVSTEISELKNDVDELKAAKLKHEGAVGTMEWISRFGPWLLAFVLGIAAIAGWERAG